MTTTNRHSIFIKRNLSQVGQEMKAVTKMKTQAKLKPKSNSDHLKKKYLRCAMKWRKWESGINHGKSRLRFKTLKLKSQFLDNPKFRSTKGTNTTLTTLFWSKCEKTLKNKSTEGGMTWFCSQQKQLTRPMLKNKHLIKCSPTDKKKCSVLINSYETLKRL